MVKHVWCQIVHDDIVVAALRLALASTADWLYSGTEKQTRYASRGTGQRRLPTYKKPTCVHGYMEVQPIAEDSRTESQQPVDVPDEHTQLAYGEGRHSLLISDP